MQRLESRREGYEATDYVFTKLTGGHYHPQVVSKMLTSAALMLDSGVVPKVAAERLGHADASLFMNLYSLVTSTMQSNAADKLGAALFGDA
jgi:integrase